MPWAAAAASVVTGLEGAIQQSNARDRAAALRNDALQKWLQINIPDPEEQKLALQQFVVAGKLTPTLAQAIKQDPSAWAQVAQDQGLKQSQLPRFGLSKTSALEKKRLATKRRARAR